MLLSQYPPIIVKTLAVPSLEADTPDLEPCLDSGVCTFLLCVPLLLL